MKSLLTIFMLFQNCFFLQAQFYTVSKHPASCKVQKQQNLPETGEVSKDDSSTKVGKSKAERPNEWIQQYSTKVNYHQKYKTVRTSTGTRILFRESRENKVLHKEASRVKIHTARK